MSYFRVIAGAVKTYATAITVAIPLGIGSLVHIAEETTGLDNDWGPYIATRGLAIPNYVIFDPITTVWDGAVNGRWSLDAWRNTAATYSKNPFYEESRSPTYLFDLNIENMAASLQEASAIKDPQEAIKALRSNTKALNDLKYKITPKDPNITLRGAAFGW